MDTSDLESLFYEWDAMPQYIANKIDLVARHVNEENIAMKLAGLNRFLERAGCIGTTSLLRTRTPIITAERMTSEGIVTEPVLDSEILGGSNFAGTFMGCVPVELEGRRITIGYQLQVEDGDQLLNVLARTSSAILEFQFDNGEEIDIKQAIAVAFETLSQTDDDEYHQLVTGLREAYMDEDSEDDSYDEDEDETNFAAAERLRAIGVWSGEILSHPLHVTDPQRTRALATILENCIDDSCRYVVSGLAYHYAAKQDGSIATETKLVRPPILVDISAIRYVPELDPSRADPKGDEIGLSNRMQPAFVAFDLHYNREIDLPFRYLESFSKTDNTDIPAATSQSCGEWAHDYARRTELGGIATSGYLKRFQ